MSRYQHAWCLAGIFSCTTVASAQQVPPPWISEGPYVNERKFSLELPLEVLSTKLYVEVVLGGKPRRFVFDTGSPSMITSALAAELGLDVVDRRMGKDSHGAIIESEIVQADMTLGGVTFHKVPMFAADFSAAKTAQCLIGDGVLGSEILPLCAWQIDLPQSVLRCDSKLKNLDHVKTAIQLRLHDFGYPHAPFLDVAFAKNAKSKAMFDTGSPGYLTISPPDFEGAKRAGGISEIVSGRGSLGGSLGGQAPNGDQVRAGLKSFSVGDVELDGVVATVRESPPSLVGASILEHFVVTLDARSGAAYLDKYREGPFVRPSFGFSLSYEPDVSVSLVWDNSPAAKAGLRVGQRLTAINGIEVASSCDGIERALRAMDEQTIRLEWEEGAAVLTRDSSARPQ